MSLSLDKPNVPMLTLLLFKKEFMLPSAPLVAVSNLSKIVLEIFEKLDPKVGDPIFLRFSKIVGSSPLLTGPVRNSDFFCSFT